MKRGALAAVTLGALGAAVTHRLWSSRERARAERRRIRWQVVTINRRPEEVMPEGRLPEPLARLGESIEVQVRDAPGGRGTELGARPHARIPSGVEEVMARLGGEDPRQAVRRALRESKCLIETGEVLRADEPAARRPAPIGRPPAVAARRAGGEERR
ncbi:hypothetical protein Sru01_66320 [Sphaerisporangium rufum]|uniref:Uncharacterized protein n=1 Tax=Sphaerisporangium rufum TaxID=1381558 RepID=A0A919RCW3_9ACTN|nr:hypothetical protein [Sphaerisporangium rufum]GII81650.1 hypothetical protein Sru01_66320 [Sphaerisporangium rufum]